MGLLEDEEEMLIHGYVAYTFLMVRKVYSI